MVLALAILVLGFASLGSYNVTWDEALGDLFFGQRYLSFFTSLDPAYLDFAADPYPAEHRPDLRLSPFRGRPWEYYPVANTLAAACSVVFSRSLGWLDPFDGFHALGPLLAALLSWVFWRFLATRWGAVAATLAVVLLLSSPRVFGHLMANIKDFPLLVLYALTLMAFLRAWESGSVRGLLLTGVLWGLALGCKANALFLPGIPLGMLLLGGPPVSWRGRTRQLIGSLVGGGVLGLLTTFASWPYLWADPWNRVWQHLDYIGFRQGHTRPESIAPVLEAVWFTTPPLLLALALVGSVIAIRRALTGDLTARLMGVWVIVAMLRYLLPQAVNFDGVRHFLELFPALAALAGLGGSWLIGKAVRHARHPESLKAVAVLLLLLPGAWATLRSHPFQLAYWNEFAGGLDGARQRGLPQAGDYWGTSYRLGFEWLNEHASQDALLAVPIVEHAVRLVAPERLREDLFLLPITTPFSPRIAADRLAKTLEAARLRPLYVMFVERLDWENALVRDCKARLQPEVVWRLEGAPVMSIYRYRPPI